jgi:hypothetical protein
MSRESSLLCRHLQTVFPVQQRMLSVHMQLDEVLRSELLNDLSGPVLIG